MAEGRAKFAAIQRSEDGLSIGVRLRVALDLLESLGEAGAALAPRGAKTKLRFDRIEIDEEGQSSLDGAGDQTGVAQLVWEIIAGKPATWSGTATDDDLPDDVPGAVLDVLGGFLNEKGKAGDVGEKLEDASRGFVDTHDDVRSAVASWRESHEEEEAAPAPPPKAPEPAPKPVAAAPKPVEAAPKPPEPAPKAPAAAPKPIAAEPTPVVAAKTVVAAPALAPTAPKGAEPAAPKVEPPPAKVEAKKPVAMRLPSELPDAWDDAPLSKRLDDVITQGELPPPESVAPAPVREPEPLLAEGRPGAPAAYPQVPPAPRAPSFPDADEAASIEAKKPGRLAPPHSAVPQPPPASVQRPPQPTVPETKAARSFIETVPPTANLVAPVATAPAGLLTQPEAAVAAAPAAPAPPPPPPPAPPPVSVEAAPTPAAPRTAANPPRAPMKTDPMRTLPKPPAPLADIKKTEPMRPRPTSANGAARAAADALQEATVETPKTAGAPAKPAPPAPPARRTVPDIKATEPFRRRLPGPHDPGGDDEPARGPLSGPLPADAAALASDGAIPLPVQPPSPAMPTAKVILDGPNKVRGQMETLYTRRPDNPTPEPVVQAAPARDFSIPAPPKKSRLALIAVVIVALLGIGLFAFLASQMQGPPEMTPTPTVTAPAPSQTVGAAAPQPEPKETAAPAPPPATATVVATADATPTATAVAQTAHAGTSHPAAPRASGGRTPPKKWQPNLPDRL